jgi:hypothetical protein
VVEGTPWFMYIAAAVPAVLLTILLFMDQQITSVIVNRKEHQLKVGLIRIRRKKSIKKVIKPLMLSGVVLKDTCQNFILLFSIALFN